MTVQFMNKVTHQGIIDFILRHICDLWNRAERMYGQKGVAYSPGSLRVNFGKEF